MGSTHPHYALIEYARDMHQYTLELWMELSKKLDGVDHSSVPMSQSGAHSGPGHAHNSGDEDPSRGRPGSDDHDRDSTEAESPQDE